MGTFKRSWDVTKITFGIIKRNKKLIVLPLLAGIFSLIFMAAMLFPTIIVAFMKAGGDKAFEVLDYILIFLTYFGLAFIATFFNVAVVHVAKSNFEKREAGLGESLKFSFSKIHLIFLWSLVSASVGLIFAILDNSARKTGAAGQIILKVIRAVLGFAWSVLTIFVVPSMVYYDMNPFAAIKKSAETLKKTWGESAVRYLGFGSVAFLLIVIGFIIVVPLAIYALSLESYISLLVVICALVIYLILIFIVFSAANNIYNTALFVYADKGQVPEGYSAEIMQSTFGSKKKKLTSSFTLGR